MVRITIRLTSSTSLWFSEAVKVLNDASRKGTPEYRLMSKLTQPGPIHSVDVSEEDERAIKSWAESLGHPPSLDYVKTTISERVFISEYRCPCGSAMKTLPAAANPGHIWECASGHGYRLIQSGFTVIAACHANPPQGLRIGNRVQWEITGSKNPVLGRAS